MLDVDIDTPEGVLRRGWSVTIDDYAIAGGWTKDGAAFAVGDTVGGVYAFDGKSGTLMWSHPAAHEGGLLAVSMHPNLPKFATTGQDGRTLIWDIASGQIEHAIDVGNSWVDNVAWSRDGDLLAVSCSRQVHVYGADGVEIWRSDDHPSTVSALAWSDTGELATTSYGRVAFFDAPTGELRQKLEWKGSLVSLALSPDGDIVACGSQDNSVHFWRRSIEQDSMMSGYPGKPAALAFDASGTLLATGGSEAVTVWSFKSGGPEGTRPGVLDFHVEAITSLAFTRRGTRLASGGRDGAVVVWALQDDGSGDAIGSAVVPGIVAEVYWRPDGRSLAALDGGGGVTSWRVG